MTLSANHPDFEKHSVVPVLAGGGSRLSAHIGVLKAIEELEVPYRHLVGVSGGSIVGALAACGYRHEEMLSIARETDFTQFSSQNLFTLFRTGGLSDGDHFESWVDEKLGGRTFADLDIDYHVVATDVRTGQAVIFNREKTPDTRVALAVRFSMSIPILFSFKEYREHLLVDGSILSEEALQRDWAGDGTPVVVFKLRSNAVHGRPSQNSMVPLRNYLEMLVNTFMITVSREYINEDFWLSTIVIETGDISPIKLNLDREEKGRLFDLGRATTLKILPTKMSRREFSSQKMASVAPAV
jgi:NTE family protein